MTFKWNPNPALDRVALELLKKESFISPETLEHLQKDPQEYKTFCFSISDIHGGGSSGSLNVTFDLLLQVGNPAAMRALLKAQAPESLGLYLSNSYRRDVTDGYIIYPGSVDFIHYFNAVNFEYCPASALCYCRRDKDPPCCLDKTAQAVADYIQSQFRIYDNRADSIYQAYNMEGVRLYHGPNRVAMYKAIHKELIK